VGLFIGLSVLLSLSPVLTREGWPHNHEHLNWKHRIEIYARHFEQGDVVPIWSSKDTFDLGSPWPAYYHRLFLTVSASCYLITESMKGSVLISLALFLLLGSAGLYLCSRKLGFDRFPACGVAMWLPFLNYTFTEWMIRAAFAELSAAMLLPWLLRWCVCLLKEDRFSYSIVPIMLLLFLGHSVIALSSLIAISAALLVFSLPSSGKRIWLVAKRAALSALLFFAPISPILYFMWVFWPYFDISPISEGALHPRSQFQPLSYYWNDPNWVWGDKWQGFTVQLDSFLLIFLGLGLLYLLVRRFRRPSGRERDGRSKDPGEKNGSSLLCCLASLVFFLFLQTRASLIVYEWIPGLDYIQFPWRLLSFIGVILLLINGEILRRIRRTAGPVIAAILLTVPLVGTIATSPITRAIGYDWFTADQLETGLRVDEQVVLGGVEYLPVVRGEKAGREFLQSISRHGDRQLEEGQCRYELREAGDLESLAATYGIECPQNGSVAIPRNYSGLERVLVREEGGQRYAPAGVYRTDSDPRVRVDLVRGTHALQVHMPTMASVFQ
jgi:hypothetical protein